MRLRTSVGSNFGEISLLIPTKNGNFQIAGVDKDLIYELSSRKREFDESIKQLRERNPNLKEHQLQEKAFKNSRAPKIEITREELRQHWNDKFSKFGLSKEEIKEKAILHSRVGINKEISPKL